MKYAEIQYIKGRGAQINTVNPFHRLQYDTQPIDWEQHESDDKIRTEFIPVHPKTIINKVKSPDIPAGYSMNPYQGCEHGCVYCYARNTHTYWGYSAGLEFEQKILVKQNVPELLEQKFKSKNWKPAPIMLSGNTDCYQPVEKEKEITRKILEVCWKYRHPVSVITKNSLILRDLDILEKLAQHGLVHVSISITTLDDEMRRVLEPRTSSVLRRLETVERLHKAGVPVNVMMAPIIPGLNDHEILPLAKEIAERGARSIGYTMVRLNGDVGEIFMDWLTKVMPDKADKIINQIKDVHGGQLSDSRFGKRMSGEGHYAMMVKQQFKLAREKYLRGRTTPPYNLDLFEQMKKPQLSLF